MNDIQYVHFEEQFIYFQFWIFSWPSVMSSIVKLLPMAHDFNCVNEKKSSPACVKNALVISIAIF